MTTTAHPLGVTRTIVLDPSAHASSKTLPLDEGEFVLTFDDGPTLPGTDEVLDVLRAEEVRALFFVLGYRATRLPQLAQRMAHEGHVVATHTEIHRMLTGLPLAEQVAEVREGIASTVVALDPYPVAPFFRFPFLRDTAELREELALRRIMVWDFDVSSDDWCGPSPEQVVAQTLAGCERKRKGVLLLHDVQPATALALPVLLREMKRRGLRIVQPVPAAGWTADGMHAGPAQEQPAAPNLVETTGSAARPGP